jgi:hypothetical protein
MTILKVENLAQVSSFHRNVLLLLEIPILVQEQTQLQLFMQIQSGGTSHSSVYLS